MKSRYWIMALAAAAVLGLSGCISMNNQGKNLEMFGPGETIIYVHVKATSDDFSIVREECKKSNLEGLSPNGFETYLKGICKNLNEFQLVQGFYYSSPIRGIQSAKAFARKDMKIERDDIVKMVLTFDAQGALDHPAMVLSIARKGKDATKESGCYWQGASVFTNAFIPGGVVCDGWDWKKQKFAQ